jgi:hypothetical protein
MGIHRQKLILLSGNDGDDDEELDQGETGKGRPSGSIHS